MIDEAAPGPAQAGARANEPQSSWAELGRGVLDELVAVARERLRLFSLEGQQFVLAAGKLLTLGVVAAVFVLTAWFVLIGGILAASVQYGLPWQAAIAIGFLTNAGAAFAVWLAMRRLLGLMRFSASLRRMRVPRGQPPPPGDRSLTAQQADDAARLAAQAAAAGQQTVQTTR